VPATLPMATPRCSGACTAPGRSPSRPGDSLPRGPGELRLENFARERRVGRGQDSPFRSIPAYTSDRGCAPQAAGMRSRPARFHWAPGRERGAKDAALMVGDPPEPSTHPVGRSARGPSTARWPAPSDPFLHRSPPGLARPSGLLLRSGAPKDASPPASLRHSHCRQLPSGDNRGAAGHHPL
jgi:hypothetical protein